ncbi:TPA: LOW QUALITY PROTEIN: hypothetical protein N0F65_002940 [Lagenidium giganteum]|uniref:UBA domain-containing protein n=1 Tax=Lagenidium giganteum TaxID=4803 RepID=A0AAV2Z712_9STRA|nr:TPA: LOW QUALITY PROTEIN: hypothetical protein N0F65_002940 [Lagenidium giganteum]
MTDAAVYFGDDFGQKIDLTVRIREILRNYPEGTSIFKELVQNADDAGATEVKLCLDRRQHGCDKLAFGKLEGFQGASLLAYNNAVFTDADFQSIQRIGDSLKKDTSKGWKTGRFGVGFNSVYHLTDLPAFVSGSQLVFFDPQACHLPNVNPSNPGKMIDFVTHSDLASNFPDQIKPFMCFGCDFERPFEGTLFRLALRTREQAQASRLSTRFQSVDHVRSMLLEFADSLQLVLLFLRNVLKISVYEWRDGDSEPTCLRSAQVKSPSAELVAKRSLKLAAFSENKSFAADVIKSERMRKLAMPTHDSLFAGEVWDYMLHMQVTNHETQEEQDVPFLVCNQLGGGECTKIANDPANASQRLVPWGGVAVDISAKRWEGVESPSLAFCFLPLPTHTYLPVHVNGYFELSSNRRDIWFGEGLSGDGLLRAQWNIALLEDVIARCYARAVMELANNTLVPTLQHMKLLPQRVPPAPWDSLAGRTLSLLRERACLFSEVDGGKWISPSRAVIVSRKQESSEQLTKLLLGDQFPVVSHLTEDLEHTLISTQTVTSYCDPKSVRDVYRRRPSSHVGDKGAIKCLLDFVVQDLQAGSMAELIGVYLLPIADGSLQRFGSNAEDGNHSLSSLVSMGFSRLHSMHALITVGHDVERALNWLMQHPNPSTLFEHQVAPTTFFVPSLEELQLLAKASGYLVDVEAVSQKVLTLFISGGNRVLNVKKLDFEGFEDLLPAVFPADWYEKEVVEWDLTKEESPYPSEEWFRLFWKYIGPSDKLAKFQGKWPIVPTSSGVLCLLGAGSSVLSPELLPPACIKSLEKLDVRLLLPNLFSSFLPHYCVWSYIHQPTPSGVVACLGHALKRSGHKWGNPAQPFFRTTSKTDRDQLRAFILSASPGEFNQAQQQVLQMLPIFHGVRSTATLTSDDVRWFDHEETTNMTCSPVFVHLGDRPLMCMGMHWKLLSDEFLFVKDDDMPLRDAFVILGVRSVSKVEFIVQHLLPRFQSIPNAVRIEFLLQFLKEIPSLLADDGDGSFAQIVEQAPIFPTISGDLRSISDLYDPEIEEFADLMDDTFFPAVQLQAPVPLSILRSLGLQRSLSRRSLLSLALSLEREQEGIEEQRQNGEEVDVSALRNRAFQYFRYLDVHFDQLVSPTPPAKQKKTKKSMKSKGMKLLRNFLGEDSASSARGASHEQSEELERLTLETQEIVDFQAKLMVMSWVPVCRTRKHPLLPLYKEDDMIVVCTPVEARLTRNMWTCSSKFHIIDCETHSIARKSAFGWNGEDETIETTAHQLKEIAIRYDGCGGGSNSSNRQVVWSAVYQLYRVLSKFFESVSDEEHQRKILGILAEAGKYVWVGSHFVAPHQVASTTLVNAEPYLYPVPSELLHFRPFLRAAGVRERFALLDYVQVMQTMYEKSRQPLEPEDQTSLPLSEDELIAAVGIVQLVSDLVPNHADYQLFAPDTQKMLTRTTTLTFNDAPWIDPATTESMGSKLRFVHPKISNEVAARTGAKSLRSQLLHASAPDELFTSSFGGVEMFGQTEALTKRISSILEQYPDGPHILSELIQNADDAGATKVSIMFSNATFGTSSLLHPNMAKWQGPALYCFNDAEFKDSDFHSLARIGQGEKLQRVATTGRFGLGFNSVYHFTDLPSIVSANSIVMFDPHASHLPSITPANPGIKVRFVNSQLVQQFPDQFQPLRMFGCDFKSHFHGTLFRFPLRNEGSEIKRHPYSYEQVVDLFHSFHASIGSTLLFLRNIQRVEVLIQNSASEEPVLLFGAEVPSEDRGDSWRKIDRFMKGSDADGSSKRAFYNRLATLREEDLPCVTGTLRVEVFERESWLSSLRNPGGAEALRAQGDVSRQKHKYLVCNKIGGGRARKLACAEGHEHLKLIPWVGVAARVDGTKLEGRAFCFLPLPVRVGLPVHVNGYFELSSNRRDIWHGDDMAGEGKLRSEWNTCLLSDAIAPAFLALLLEARQICETDVDLYYSLFPTSMPQSPWSLVVKSLGQIMRDKPVFAQAPADEEVSSSLVYVCPSTAVLIDEQVKNWQLLETATRVAALHPVRIPSSIRQLLVELDAVHGSTTPAFFRSLIRRGSFAPQLADDVLGRVIEFCVEDCKDESWQSKLIGLNILPMCDGSFAAVNKISAAQGNVFYFGNDKECQLLESCNHKLVIEKFKSVFADIPLFFDASNVRILDVGTIVEHFLPRILPRHWRNVSYVGWEPDQDVAEPSVEWMRRLWACLDDHADEAGAIFSNLCEWPLLPIQQHEKTLLARADGRSTFVVQHPDSPVSLDSLLDVQETLRKLGIFVVDASIVGGRRILDQLIAAGLVHKLNSDGVLYAIRHRVEAIGSKFEQLFSGVSDHERMVLCDFICATADKFKDDAQAIVVDLPIFRVHPGVAAAGSSSGQYASVSSNAALPESGFDERVLNHTFFAPSSPLQRNFLKACGIEEWTTPRILMDFVFPQLQALDQIDSKLVDEIVVRALTSLAIHSRHEERFREFVETQPIIPSRKRVFRSVKELYDPQLKELEALVGPNSLPAVVFCTPAVLNTLRDLGLRHSLSCHALLESAREVESLFDEGRVSEAKTKAKNLLVIMNRHFDEMAEQMSGDENSEEELDGLLRGLKEAKWLPVHSTPIARFMPWALTKTENDVIISRPMEVRPTSDATKHILDGELQSEFLIAAFDWDQPVDCDSLCQQLRALGESWSWSGDSSLLTSSEVKMMTSKVCQAYDLLEECLKRTPAALQDTVLPLLRDSKWVWTGEEVVQVSAIAFECEEGLNPVLHGAPHPGIISRQLLELFGVHETFELSDYVSVLRRLPQGVPLDEHTAKACVKIFSILKEAKAVDESALLPFADSLMLLDSRRRLLRSAELMFDYMAWSNDPAAREGCDLVHPDVSQDVAVALGARSLHFRQAMSAASAPLSCPTPDQLRELLSGIERKVDQRGSEWIDMFFSEVMCVAERLHGKRVDFFVDTRAHPSERVVHPSFQALCGTAICAHIDGATLKPEALENASRKRAGLFSGFGVSDCLQILSGENLFVLDPSGEFLHGEDSETQGPKSSTARRYDVTSPDFRRYPDQLLPFQQLPFGSSSRSVILRCPLRENDKSRRSIIDCHVPSTNAFEKKIKEGLEDSIVFTESVSAVSMWVLGDNNPRCVGRARVDTAELEKRSLTRRNQEWRRKFSLQSFFKAPVIPENNFEFTIISERDGVAHTSRWLYVDNNGVGRSRDLANTSVHEVLNSVPFVAIACPVFRNEEIFPCTQKLVGRIFDGTHTTERTGLPVHINGAFKRQMRERSILIEPPQGHGSNDVVLIAQWNSVLLEDGVVEAYLKLLQLIKRLIPSSELYQFWPSVTSKQRSNINAFVTKAFYGSIGAQELFLCSDGSFKSLKAGYVIDSKEFDLQVVSFARLHFPSFNLPPHIMRDCRQYLPSQVQSLTPRVIRRYLRSMATSSVGPDVCVALLEYCLSDILLPIPPETSAVWSEFHGLPLLPLADGSIGTIRVNQRAHYVLASYNQQQLLLPLSSQFISLFAQRRLHGYFSDDRFKAIMGLNSFTIKTLADSVSYVLPAAWKNQSFVEWDPQNASSIDKLWLYRFWQEVRFERRSLQYFSMWPLIPVKGSRLLSCGSPDAVMCVWSESFDSAMRDTLMESYQESLMKHQDALAQLENERKRMRDLWRRESEKSATQRVSSVEEDLETGVSDDEMKDDGAEETRSDGSMGGDTAPNNATGEVEASEMVAVEAGRDVSDGGEASANGDLDEPMLDANAGATEDAGSVVSASAFDFMNEFCSRDRLHALLMQLNAPVLELAYFVGQEKEIIPTSQDLAIKLLDGLCATTNVPLAWNQLDELDATLLAELFADHSRRHGGFNRMHLDMLRRLPLFVNVGGNACALRGEFYFVPSDIDLSTIPLPANAQQSFLRVNPNLIDFYRELGVQEMDYVKLFTYVLPLFHGYSQDQCNRILDLLKIKWPVLRGNAEVMTVLRATSLFRDEDGVYHMASEFFDPRNKLFTTMYSSVPNAFPPVAFASSDWLDILEELGLKSEVTVEIFVDCAKRIERMHGEKSALTPRDEQMVGALHQYFVQNYERFDRARLFFEQVAAIKFVPAVVYDDSTNDGPGGLATKTILVKYKDCAVPDDQALVFLTLPILKPTALPPRVLFSRLGIDSPPKKATVLQHLFNVTDPQRRSGPGNWQFFLPIAEVFQELFKYLQANWEDELSRDERQQVSNTAIVPVGSSFVKASRLFFHLSENLAPLMYEVPRAFGAYDTLFRGMGSKDTPEIQDYVRLLTELHAESKSNALTLNELIAVTRMVALVSAQLTDTSMRLSMQAKESIFLPSSTSVMRPMLQMAYNDSPWIFSRINLTELHVVHPRINPQSCRLLGIPGLTEIVKEELSQSFEIKMIATPNDVMHYNAAIASQEFTAGLRQIISAQQQKESTTQDGFPDFEDINSRIVALRLYQVKCVERLQSRFVAYIGHRSVDVTKDSASNDSVSFIDRTNQTIYIAQTTLESHPGLRMTQVLSSCINQLLGSILTDCSSLESILQCDVVEIISLLRFMNVCEDPALIEEKLRGVPGEGLSTLDEKCAEISPVRSFSVGEIVAVEQQGELIYAKVLQVDTTGTGVSTLELKLARDMIKSVPSTQVYAFRSSRDLTGRAPTSARADLAMVLSNAASDSSAAATLPPSVARAPLAPTFLHQGESLRPVDPENVVSAVNDILGRVNLSLSTTFEELIAENQRLQRQLEQAEEGRRLATAQIDDAIRDKKDAQDSLTCAICLEHQVDRVLIPCGHIYCSDCVARLPRRSCPVCRQNISDTSPFHAPYNIAAAIARNVACVSSRTISIELRTHARAFDRKHPPERRADAMGTRRVSTSAPAPSPDELVRLEKVHFSDDEDDDNFQYAAVDDNALDLDEEDEEEDFEAVLRNLNKLGASGAAGGAGGSGDKLPQQPSPDKPEASGGVSPSISPKAGGLSNNAPRIHMQVRPAVVDDFIRNFLIKVGMLRTLDMFNHEWYEFISKGKLKEDDIGVVPDIYLRNQALDDQVKELRKQLDETRKITEKAKGTWDKFRHQRDVHKMHHQRVLQEKEALAIKIKKLEKHVASYEPLLAELKTKYENSMKEKMLMRLERDRQLARADALEAQLKAHATTGPAGPAATSKAKDQGPASTSSTKAGKKKSSEAKIPAHDGVNPYLDKRFEPVNPARIELAKTCQGHGNSIAAVAFHPKNPILATVSDDETWKLWSVPACELIMSGEGHRSWLAGIDFHPRGTHVATSSGDNTVKLWDFVSASCSLTLSDHSHPVWESVFHHDGDFLVSASMDHTCKLWDLTSGKCRKTFRGHVDSVNSVCFQPYTGNICTGSGDKTISIWDIRSGLCVQTFYGHQNACNSVAFALAGDTIASCDADGYVKVWDVRMVAERCSMDGGQHPLNSIAFDRSGKTLAAASDDGSIKIFNSKSDKFVAELKGHDGPVQSVKFEPNGRFLASASSDCTFRLWST